MYLYNKATYFLTLTPTHIDVLLAQCKSGNQQAQLEVYSRYCKAMYNTSFRIVKDSYLAEDIMQESFLTAFTKLETLQDASRFGPWLKRIVINNSISEIRQQQKNRTVPLEDMLYKTEDTLEIAGDDGNTNMNAARILHCMDLLQENYRLSLTLNLIEGYDYEEISQIMNISYANCRTMISRAKESLRKKLTPAMKH